jgi:hypothetical protein
MVVVVDDERPLVDLVARYLRREVTRSTPPTTVRRRSR